MSRSLATWPRVTAGRLTAALAQRALRAPLSLLPLLLLTVLNPARAGDVAHGADLYRRHCSACHGAGGRPVLPNAPDFTRATALLRSDPELLARMRDGRGAMPAYRGLLRDRELLDIVAHLRTLK